MTKLVCSIAALMLHRGRMTNQERLDHPLTRDEATRFVLESNSPMHIFFGLHRLMDIAFDLWRTDYKEAKILWQTVGQHLQTVVAIDPNLVGFNTLMRYSAANVHKDLASWAKEEALRRDADQTELAHAA